MEQQHKQPPMVVRDKVFLQARSAIYYILGVIEVLLIFRFLFKMMAANPASGFVAVIYAITDALLIPYFGIFKSTTARSDGVQVILEPATLVGVIVYALIAWGIIKLIEIYRITRQ